MCDGYEVVICLLRVMGMRLLPVSLYVMVLKLLSVLLCILIMLVVSVGVIMYGGNEIVICVCHYVWW